MTDREEMVIELKLVDEIAQSKFSWSTFVKGLKLFAFVH